MTKLKIPDEVVEAIATDGMNLFLRRMALEKLVAPDLIDSQWEVFQNIKREISASLVPKWRQAEWNETEDNKER